MFTLPVSGQLPASKTHRERRWHFTANADTSKPGIGVVSIAQGKRDFDSYGIEIEDGAILFAKLDNAADVYGVECTRAGVPVRCTCKGFSCTKHCKHIDAAREMISEGIIA